MFHFITTLLVVFFSSAFFEENSLVIKFIYQIFLFADCLLPTHTHHFYERSSHILFYYFCGKAKVAEFFSSSRVPRIHLYRAFFFCYQVIECAYNMYLSYSTHFFGGNEKNNKFTVYDVSFSSNKAFALC